ncbi:hypothetical protein GCM10028800_09260 [Nesterenkonia populi]
MHELSRAMGHASYAITDKVYAHVRPRDFSAHRAAFSAHISAASAPVAPWPLSAAKRQSQQIVWRDGTRARD